MGVCMFEVNISQNYTITTIFLNLNLSDLKTFYYLFLFANILFIYFWGGGDQTTPKKPSIQTMQLV